MRAARIHRFGPPEVIVLEDVARPEPAEGEVLVQVAAAGVGPWDAWIRAGRSVLPQPLPLTLGSDLAGVVVALGPDVSDLALGQAVFGVTNARFTGAYAEQALAQAAMLATKPARFDFAAAAALPVVAVTAQQMLFDHAHLRAGQRVLVHGAGGSVGALAVQLARAAGAEVIGSETARGVDYVRSLGVGVVLDAGQPGFERDVGVVDAVIDTVGGEGQARLMTTLAPGGVMVSSVSRPDANEAARRGVRATFMLVDVTRAALERVAQLVDAGQLVARLGPTLQLAEARLAHEMLDGLRPRAPGKIVLAIDA